jgi:catechol 2,3-dioxygenase-like lactoylglutathione lyase family enzyme
MKLSKIIPAFPVHNIPEAVRFYKQRLGFECRYQDQGFARLLRDEAELHLWLAGDQCWQWRRYLPFVPVLCTGTESFLAGTHSCRIQAESIDELYAEYKESRTLYNDQTKIEATGWGTREFAALDLHRNLLIFYEPC